MRCACTCPSSCGGVSQTTLTLMLFFADSSLAAASAPVRAARNTGLVELFAMTAMVILFLLGPAAAVVPAPVVLPAVLPASLFPPHAARAIPNAESTHVRRFVMQLLL